MAGFGPSPLCLGKIRNCFILGLRPNIQCELAVLQLSSISQAISLEKLLELKPVTFAHFAACHRHLQRASCAFSCSYVKDPVSYSAFVVVENVGSSRPKCFAYMAQFMNTLFVYVLFGSGSLHNIVQPHMTGFLGLQVTPLTSFPILVGNGASLHCSGFGQPCLSPSKHTTSSFLCT
ncbi:hypothetical protein Salat_0592900 [Sesamum alatum]|uniref:Uncharacterized protein n=1 Tax=Sesamum alatum TaxID=300844 RepID=A0AAE2CTS9_9LAMI|nr:hypothetical protein Salat_0592900 [Sesamum alatum]